MRFRKGDPVVVCPQDDRGYYYTKAGSEGIVQEDSDGPNVLVRFYKLTGANHAGINEIAFPIEIVDLELQVAYNSPLWLALK